jgi:hypothetical protein
LGKDNAVTGWLGTDRGKASHWALALQ